MADMPPSPFGPMAEGAAAFHETFKSYVEAGFTEDQALKLIAYTMAACMRMDDDG